MMVRFILVLIFFLLMSFQNCSEPPVNVSAFSSLSHSMVNIQGSLCIEQGFSLTNFFIVNSSVKPDSKFLVVDADRDGLSNFFERKHGFDPHQARSRGKVLDGLCFFLTQSNDCEDLEIQCEGKENEMGFSDCDVNALNLGFNSTEQLGLDSDNDGIPDKIEVIYELDPSVDDALLDYDNDGLTNIVEVTQQTSPRESLSVKPQFFEEFVTVKTEGQNTGCRGENWEFSSSNQKVFNLGVLPSEDLEKNHFWIIALSEKSVSQLEIKKKMQYIFFKRDHEQDHETLTFKTDDFLTADNDFFR